MWSKSSLPKFSQNAHPKENLGCCRQCLYVRNAGGILPLSHVVAGGLALVVGLLVIFALEQDYYLLAGLLSFGVPSKPPD